MLIKSIEFQDFRPFKGKQKLDLTCDEDKNVVVVLAQNACGKTTLILSFIWCLYGQSKFEKKEDLLNRSRANDMLPNDTATASVRVILVHENTTYNIFRSVKYTKSSSGEVSRTGGMDFEVTYIDENGETKSCGTRENEKLNAINSIMPQNLSSYFFFEGEKNNAVTKTDISDAVKKLLGLDIYENAMRHLYGNTITKAQRDSVIGYFESKSYDSSNSDAVAEYNKMNKKSEELEEIKKQIETAKEDYDEYDKKIEEINQKLREAKPTQELQKRRDEIHRSEQRERETLNKNYRLLFSDFTNEAYNLFLYPLLKQVEDKLNEMNFGDKGIAGIEIKAIKELLSRGFCLCGTCLDEGTVACKKVKEYIDILPPKNVGSLVRDTLDSVNNKRYLSDNYLQKVEMNYKDIQLSINELEKLERDETECLERLSKLDKLDIKEYESQLKLYKQRRSDAKNRELRLVSEQTRVTSELQTAEKNYNMYRNKSKDKEKYQIYTAYATAVYEWFRESYSAQELIIKKQIQDEFAKLFNAIYVGNRQAVIDERYNLHVYNNGHEQALTGALHIIKYFSFVGALVEIATKRINEAGGIGENYPLVLDAAFSHTDDNHTQAISRELAKTTKQLVFAVMEKDWNYAQNSIKDRVNKIYKIEKVSEDISEIEILEDF